MVEVCREGDRLILRHGGAEWVLTRAEAIDLRGKLRNILYRTRAEVEALRIEVERRIAAGEKHQEIAAALGISTSYVGLFSAGERGVRAHKEEAVSPTRWTSERVAELRSLTGLTLPEIAAYFTARHFPLTVVGAQSALRKAGLECARRRPGRKLRGQGSPHWRVDGAKLQVGVE